MNDSATVRRRPLLAASGALRLAEGGLIDRSRRLAFTFDGATFHGHPGDTLASALVANGVRLVGRSFKYHRPRGLLSAGPEEPSALVELRSGARREPNTRATVAELFDGLDAQSQNRWPSLKFDLMSVNGLFGPMLAAGFYYKTFMWPASFWEKVYEPLIRRAAGLGRGSGLPDPDLYEKAHLHCDVLVIGSGPAGLMAALAAGRTGARVVLAEQDFRIGGRLLLDSRIIAGAQSQRWVADIEGELSALPEVRILRRTNVFGSYDHGTFAAVERVNDHVAIPAAHEPRQRLWRIIAKQAVLAAGAIERPLVFADNDRPGVMLSGAVRGYLNRFAAAAGRRAVVATNNDDAVETVRDLAEAGIDVAAVVDLRDGTSEALATAAREASARYVSGGAVVRAHGGHGVEGVTVRDAAGQTSRIDCDLVAVSGGFSPSVQLASHQGRRPVWREDISAFVPGDLPKGLSVAGAVSGDLTLAGAFAAGARAGLAAAEATGHHGSLPTLPPVEPEAAIRIAPPRVATGKGKSFVDFQNDVTVSDVEIAHREGFRAVEHLKRYTTLGMATDQGKTSNVNGLALMADLTRRSIPETGTTTFRPPVEPVALGVLGGHHRGKDFRPTRLTPSHGWAKARGAVFVETGPWLRAQWYPQAGETDWLESVNREVKAVRNGVGICDVSTLGRIDVQGPDAARLLDRLYTNTMSTVPIGKSRYGLMLREDGFVMDDGTVSRLGPEWFYVTTTTVNAAKVLGHMELALDWHWPELDVAVTSVGEAWAQVSVAGPRSRDVLAKVIDRQHDISNGAFAYLAAAEMTAMGGVPARLFRISYSGELAYEIAVPSSRGEALVEALMAAGEPFGITPYGTEALGVMRIEKGHVAGNELSGQTTAHDLGLGKMLSKKKDYIGRAMAERPVLIDPARPSLVGLKPVDRGARLRAGAHLVAAGVEPVAANDQGYVTSVAFSPTLGHWIGLGLLANGPRRHGETCRAWDPVRNGDVAVEVCDPVFVDPEGVRLHG